MKKQTDGAPIAHFLITTTKSLRIEIPLKKNLYYILLRICHHLCIISAISIMHHTLHNDYYFNNLFQFLSIKLKDAFILVGGM